MDNNARTTEKIFFGTTMNSRRKRHSYNKKWQFNERKLFLEKARVDQATNANCSSEKPNELIRAAGLGEFVASHFGSNEEFEDDN